MCATMNTHKSINTGLDSSPSSCCSRSSLKFQLNLWRKFLIQDHRTSLEAIAGLQSGIVIPICNRLSARKKRRRKFSTFYAPLTSLYSLNQGLTKGWKDPITSSFTGCDQTLEGICLCSREKWPARVFWKQAVNFHGWVGTTMWRYWQPGDKSFNEIDSWHQGAYKATVNFSKNQDAIGSQIHQGNCEFKN